VPSEKELLDRIRELEEMNSALQDKLDEIWAVLAPIYHPDEDAPEEDPGDSIQDDLIQGDLIQIDVPFKRPS
jgi:hypothetical protein